MKKFLFFIIGETYRCGGQMSRSRGDNNSNIGQEKAIESHINFINNQKIINNLDCDVILNLYSLNKEKDDNILDLYKSCNIIKHFFHKNLMGEKNLLNNSIEIKKDIIRDDYKYLIITRADIFIKPYFYDIFNNNSDKIKFSFMNEYLDHRNIPQCGKIINNTHVEPSICHIITYIPNKYFNTLFETKFLIYNHDAYKILMKYYNNDITEYTKHLSLFINTYHSSSTNLLWNPIFYQVGRKETNLWKYKNKAVNLKTLEIYENDTEYYNN